MNIITKIKEGLIVKLIAKVFLICAYTLNISAQTQLIDIFKDGVVSGQIDSTYSKIFKMRQTRTTMQPRLAEN